MLTSLLLIQFRSLAACYSSPQRLAVSSGFGANSSDTDRNLNAIFRGYPGPWNLGQSSKRRAHVLKSLSGSLLHEFLQADVRTRRLVPGYRAIL
jgi:hypothetical protein